ncbi:hypothetical protein Tco_1484617 [Tanacetum coccineum]
MKLLMIEGKNLKDQENPLGIITEDRKAGIGSPHTRDLTTDCSPTYPKAQERSSPQKRQLEASNNLLIEEAVKSGQLSHLVKGIKKERVKAFENQRTEGKKDKSTTPVKAPILMIRQDESYMKNKFEGLTSEGMEITFPSGGSISSTSVVIKAKIFGREVNRVHMDSGSSCEFDSPYNMLLGRTAMQKMGIVVSTIHRAIKFHTTKGIGTVFSTHESDKVKEGMKKVRETPPANEKGFIAALQQKKKWSLITNVFAWTHADMTGIPRTIIVKGKPFNTEHTLNEYSHVKPIKQKRRGLGPDHSTTACKEVDELMKVGILRKVKHQTWVANPVMGYHQIQMAEGYEDKTAFFAGEGVFCYRKMPFALKNAGATYQRLVDKVFHDQIGRNLEAYVDDMVIKTKTSTAKDLWDALERQMRGSEYGEQDRKAAILYEYETFKLLERRHLLAILYSMFTYK